MISVEKFEQLLKELFEEIMNEKLSENALKIDVENLIESVHEDFQNRKKASENTV